MMAFKAFQKLFPIPNTIIDFLFASFKLLTNFENTETILRNPSLRLVDDLQCRPFSVSKSPLYGL
jgi:hypothetical protein